MSWMFVLEKMIMVFSVLTFLTLPVMLLIYYFKRYKGLGRSCIVMILAEIVVLYF